MISHYIENSFMIDIKSTTFQGALSELLECCPISKKQKKTDIVKTLLAQENAVSSYLGQGISLPHIKVSMRKSYLFAIGRVRMPLKDPTIHSSGEIKLIVLFLVSDKINNYLTMLSAFAKTIQSIKVTRDLTTLPLDELKERFLSASKNISVKRARTHTTFNRLMIREAIKIAKAGDCSSLFVFQDAFESALEKDFNFGEEIKTVIVSHRAAHIPQKNSTCVLPVRLFSIGRLSQLRSAILLALIHNYVQYDEKICCLGGIAGSNRLDTIVIVEVKREIQSVFSQQNDILPPNVLPEVFERLLSIATELAIEGREGKPIGCMFVLGDAKELEKYTHPLILNPFYGYSEEDRNLLNPFIDETIKEYSLLDGAFVVDGSGIVESAGSLIHANKQVALPGGLGTRHAAAVSISQAANCIALTISSSTGQISLFRNGKMLPLFDKGVGTHQA